MRVLYAFGDTPLATAARIHEAASNARTCCEEHARADVGAMWLGPGPLRFPTEEETAAEVCRILKGVQKMATRAKFRVASVEYYSEPTFTAMRKVKLYAQMDDGIPENQRYAKLTPSGTIEITIDNPPAAEVFQPGKVFYVDFTETQ